MTLDPLYRAVAWILVQIHSGLSTFLDPNSGWAWGGSIVLLTMLMRILIFPLFVKQIQSSRKMAALNPQMQALRKKYKNDKQRLNQEMMKLYQENGANPISGCLPLLVQFPVFISLFQVLSKIANAKEGNGSHGISAELVASAKNASIFGAHISDSFIAAWGNDPKSITALIVCAVAVIISSTTTFLTMRASMQRQPAMDPDNPMASAQKMMVWLAPVFGLFGLGFPLGVLLYWVTSNSWTLAQSHYIYKRYPMPTGQDADKSGSSSSSAKAPAKKEKEAPSSGGLLKKRRADEAAAAAEIRKEPTVRKQPVRQTRSKRSGSTKR
ncbi:YidC/Oxa1 family membrane protein insertase [Actinocorallia herbida]|uniref:Membrane protein insertase YidC n=1 Tax=Actinocorallia herbida TaxID=58109 RepID=A0A3N1DB28_9ACTN|nr:membrane protein insertase YidC [Actinocorallia herbida]ROO90709.1 YidC/Oxa1 family membrane protein insertase [Actinocorallia herbida]